MYAILALAAFQFAAAQKTIDIKDFTVLAVSGGVEITLVPSSENKLIVEEGDPDKLDVASEDGALAISADRDEFRITIHFKGNSGVRRCGDQKQRKAEREENADQYSSRHRSTFGC